MLFHMAVTNRHRAIAAIRLLTVLLIQCQCLPVAMAQTAQDQPLARSTNAVQLAVCHGYGCYFRTLVTLTPPDLSAIAGMFAKMGTTAAGEREAIKKAVAIFEERATQVIGVRDEAKMVFGKPKRKGQMDCVDEAVNTETLLRYLKRAGYLHYHDILPRTARGVFIDGRYPHWTAVMIDSSGVKWAVDSWYEPGGGEPDIMPLKAWKKRGIGGQR